MGVLYEYRRQKRESRVQLAQSMIERLTGDDMLLFATTTLDWGAGRLIVPEAWREEIAAPAINWYIKEISDAVVPKLLPVTSTDPKRLLYRHAFVLLFNHLERIAYMVESEALRIQDLKALSWLTNELYCWTYAPEGKSSIFFRPALKSWYPHGAPQRLIDAVVSAYPRPDVSETT